MKYKHFIKKNSELLLLFLIGLIVCALIYYSNNKNVYENLTVCTNCLSISNDTECNKCNNCGWCASSGTGVCKDGGESGPTTEPVYYGDSLGTNSDQQPIDIVSVTPTATSVPTNQSNNICDSWKYLQGVESEDNIVDEESYTNNIGTESTSQDDIGVPIQAPSIILQEFANDEYNPLSEEYNPLSEEYNPLSEEYRIMSEEYQLLNDEYRPSSEEYQSLSEEYQLSNSEEYNEIPIVIADTIFDESPQNIINKVKDTVKSIYKKYQGDQCTSDNDTDNQYSDDYGADININIINDSNLGNNS
jgi:hypothetical protein